MALLLHPAYFPNCASMAGVVKQKVIWETCDNFQKQTYRNRCYIATDRGRLMMNIPIKHVGGETGRQPYKDVRIDSAYPWQRQHWRSLQTAYRAAPFFEYYEEDLRPLFDRSFTYLLDLNLATIECICGLLGCAFAEERTTEFHLEPSPLADCRSLIIAKGKPQGYFPVYTQVFQEKHGFLPNLSTLDLLFNEGPAAPDYLISLELSCDG